MALLKLLRSGQVTLPAELRQKLRLREGDYLEAEVVEGGLFLKPVAVVDRDKAWNELVRIVDKPKWRGAGPEPSGDEVMTEVVEDIKAMRRADESRSR